MRVAWLLCFMQLRLARSQYDATNSSNKTELHIGFITSFGGQYNSSGTVPAVEMALEQINSRTDVLPNYTLSLHEGMVGDSQVALIQVSLVYTICILRCCNTTMRVACACTMHAMCADNAMCSQPFMCITSEQFVRNRIACAYLLLFAKLQQLDLCVQIYVCAAIVRVCACTDGQTTSTKLGVEMMNSNRYGSIDRHIW